MVSDDPVACVVGEGEGLGIGDAEIEVQAGGGGSGGVDHSGGEVDEGDGPGGIDPGTVLLTPLGGGAAADFEDPAVWGEVVLVEQPRWPGLRVGVEPVVKGDTRVEVLAVRVLLGLEFEGVVFEHEEINYQGHQEHQENLRGNK